MSRPDSAPGASEFRICLGKLSIHKRDDGSIPKIIGHASVFDEWTTLYDGTYYCWREIVRPGAFRNAIAEKQDVVALFNHDDDDLPLARTTSKTLTLSEDSVGLLAVIDPPDTQCARDLCTSIARGDVNGMSFAFRVRPGGEKTTITNPDGKTVEERELLDLDLVDVSVVTFPAYPQTDVAIRSRAEPRDRPRRDPWLDRAWMRLRFAEADR